MERLEPENQACGGAPEIELRLAQRDPEHLEVLEGVEIADVAAHTDVTAQEDNEAPADVPSEVIVVALDQTGRRELDLCLDKPQPDQPYGCTGPNRGASIALPITVSTLEETPGMSPKKSFA